MQITPRQVLGKGLALIKPSIALKGLARREAARLQQAATRANLKAELALGGSVAKGTYLAGPVDIDLFVRFDYAKYAKRDAELADLLEPIMPEEAERVHGSRDYYQYVRKQKGVPITFEVVPVLKVSDPKKALNVTDISPLHVDYVLRRLGKQSAKGLKLADEIRLAKQFCKSARCYGAESYIQGFSGHVLDLLVIHHGGLLQLLEAAANVWPLSGPLSKGKVIIDPEAHYKNELTVLEKLDKAKTHSPLVLVDPIQPERNAAAALSREQYERFITAARAFLEKPALKFFKEQKLTVARIKKLTEKYSPVQKCVFELQTDDAGGSTAGGGTAGGSACGGGKKDVLGAKCMKAYKYVVKHARLYGFTILESDWQYVHAADPAKRRALCYIVVNEKQLPAKYESEGPPLKAKGHAAKKFRAKHEKAGHRVTERDYGRGRRLYATLTRKERTIKELVVRLLAEEPVTSRVNKAKLLK